MSSGWKGSAWRNIYGGDHAAAGVLIDELVALADEKGTLFWKGYGLLLRGWLLDLTGSAASAVATITAGSPR